jgi:hypothetical protein
MEFDTPRLRCVGRESTYGQPCQGDRRKEHGGDVPAAGFYTYGEIARAHGIRGIHNQTLVVLALS